MGHKCQNMKRLSCFSFFKYWKISLARKWSDWVTSYNNDIATMACFIMPFCSNLQIAQFSKFHNQKINTLFIFQLRSCMILIMANIICLNIIFLYFIIYIYFNVLTQFLLLRSFHKCDDFCFKWTRAWLKGKAMFACGSMSNWKPLKWFKVTGCSLGLCSWTVAYLSWNLF
jgi:hypothetical protein